MIDFSTATAIVARRPLVLLLGIFVLGGAVTHFLFKKYPIGRAVVRVIFLILLTIALLYRDIVPYRPLELTETPFLDAVHVVLKIAWWLYAAWFLVGVLRAALGSPREAKFLQDLFAGLIYLAAVFAIVAYVFDLPVQGLLATSGAVAIILGLALQSTLGDVFSGIVLSFSRAYRPGDWISLEGGTDGRVIEMNWRATYVLTGRRDLATVPNSTIAKSKIVNVSSPSGIHGTTVAVQLDAKTPPATGTEILEHALLNCKLILATPAPTITIKTTNGSYTEFELTFFVEELTSTTKAQNEFFDAMYRHLAVAGVDLAPPQDQPDRTAEDQALQAAKTRPEKLLELVAIFATLTSDERATIATKLKQKFYEKGETLVDPGIVVRYRCRCSFDHSGRHDRRRDGSDASRTGRLLRSDRHADWSSRHRENHSAHTRHRLRARQGRPRADSRSSTASVSRTRPRTCSASSSGPIRRHGRDCEDIAGAPSHQQVFRPAPSTLRHRKRRMSQPLTTPDRSPSEPDATIARRIALNSDVIVERLGRATRYQ